MTAGEKVKGILMLQWLFCYGNWLMILLDSKTDLILAEVHWGYFDSQGHGVLQRLS